VAVLRFLSLITLSVWIGGLAVLAIVAPVLFVTLEGQDPVAGRELAGAAFGAAFRHFQSAAWLCGGLLLALLGARAALGPRPRRLAVRLWVVLGMLAVSVATTVAIIPRIDRLRAQTAGPIAALPAEDSRRASFNRLHGLSNGLMLLTLGAGLALLWFETTDTA
jgi:hypothetical protein